MKECFWCGTPIKEDYKFGVNTVFHNFCSKECSEAWQKEYFSSKNQEVESEKVVE